MPPLSREDVAAVVDALQSQYDTTPLGLFMAEPPHGDQEEFFPSRFGRQREIQRLLLEDVVERGHDVALPFYLLQARLVRWMSPHECEQVLRQVACIDEIEGRGRDVGDTRIRALRDTYRALYERVLQERHVGPRLTHCEVRRIHLTPIPDDPKGLLLGAVGDHQVVVGDHYEEGSLGVFIPEGAYIPDGLADEMWVKGRLGGNRRNRVKSRIMGGHLSEGLWYGSIGPSFDPAWVEGQDVTAELGVTFAPPGANGRER